MAQQTDISKTETTQTAVDWLVNELESEAITDYSFAQAHKLITLDVYTFNKLIEQAKEMEMYQHGLFLHWFVKHYETATIDGMFGFVDAMGKEVTVKEIVDHYYNETKKIKL